MKTNNIRKISAIVLGICALISVVVFGWFYIDLLTQPDMNQVLGLDMLLIWMYILLGITLLAALAGIVWSSFKNR